MDGYVAGVDIGTSSVKVLCINQRGDSIAERQSYQIDAMNTVHQNVPAWWEAIRLAFRRLSQKVGSEGICAIGLTSQVGTYILYNQERNEAELPVVNWRSPGGHEQLAELKKRFDTEYFKEHISMEHPDLISYPAPRILWFERMMKGDWDRTDKLLSPKDYFYYKFTGLFASDPFTWRGLANLHDRSFHDVLLKDLGISREKLPELFRPDDAPGRLTPDAAVELGVKSGIPVFTGCNDFFASLLGMGIFKKGQCFDITGTSEHIGVIGTEEFKTSKLVSGPYINGYIQYGVTASSGSSMDWGFRTFGADTARQVDIQEALSLPAPIYLPYMQGERAPVWDANARGVFFGLEVNHDSRSLMYSILEGVAFSLYHIWTGITAPENVEVQVGGGAAFDDTLNQIKADLFQLPFKVMKEKESAALGAAILAGTGLKWFDTLQQAIEHWVKVDHIIEPCMKFSNNLKHRFDIYKNLHPLLRGQFDSWSKYKEVIRHGG